jgi:hypothetical protein
MPKILEAINGKKVYIGVTFGIIALLLHRLGVPMPGVTVDDAAVTNNIYMLLMVAFGRAAMPDKKGPVA